VITREAEDRVAAPREKILEAVVEVDSFDIVIVGGGIHGACAARFAAMSGFRTLLLEKADYAAGTSSRSSKMAHGGLRYLEMFDFQQVFEGIRSREELFQYAPQAVKPERFLIPVPRRGWWFWLKLKIGLTLYDLMVQKKERRHRWIPRAKLSFKGFTPDRTDLAGCFQYTDGLMNDARLVIENIVSAREHGALCLNYAPCLQVFDDAGGSESLVQFADFLTKVVVTVRTRLVINCAGPWAPLVQKMESAGNGGLRAKYSRGTHALFNVPWRDPTLFLPLAEKGRYYFVWPHEGGTMVGTTERDVIDLPDDPLPSQDELEEILDRLAKDIPDAGLNSESLYYAFAGIRTLPLRGSGKRASQLSRKHIWKLDRGVLSLLGGKYTTYAWTAAEGVVLAAKALGRPLGSGAQKVSFNNQGLPGYLDEAGRKEMLCTLTGAHNIPAATAERALDRLGGYLARYLVRPEALAVLADGVLAAEVYHAFEIEQAVTLEDVMRRRIDLELMPGFGERSIDEVVATVERCTVGRKLGVEESEAYRRKVATVTAMIERVRAGRGTR
jgi:glycerol-3-phosphate dehydrogenase